MRPDGLIYRSDFLTFDEEGSLLELLDRLAFEPIVSDVRRMSLPGRLGGSGSITFRR